MKLFRYYKEAVIYPSLFIVFFCIINSIIANYESGGRSDYSAIFLSIITTCIFSLLMSMLTLTIFLNKFKKLNNNLIWNILTWFLLPFSYLVIIFVHDIKIRINYGFGFGNDFIYLLIITLPFVIGLGWTFIRYRQKIKTTNIL
jgi:hypothetical protein